MTTPPHRGWSERHQQAAEAHGFPSWAAWVAQLETERGHTICGRARKVRDAFGQRTGEWVPCVRPEADLVPNKAKGPCKWHGGMTPMGEASPHYRHGNSPSAVTTLDRLSIRERIELWLDNDPRRTLQIGMAALMARLEELLERLDSRGVGPDTMREARDVVVRMRAAQSTDELLDHLRSLQTMIQDGAHADETWDAILVVFDRIKSGAEVHRRMLIDAGEMVERSRVLMLIDRLSTDMIAVINEMEVADEQKREARIRVSNLVGTYLNRASLPPSRNAPTPD